MAEQSDRPVAYTDGGCLGNPGPGGWGIHVEYPDGRVMELGGSELRTTNNRMELRAAIEAVRATTGWPSATIVTDSQYVRQGITGWVAGWKRKNWVTSTGQPVLNRDLWEELDALADARISWEWTRGHSGDPGNERCDQIAGFFSSTVAPLGQQPPVRTRRGDDSVGSPGGAAPDGRRAAAERSAGRDPGPRSVGGGSRPAGQIYLSLVDGILARHKTWGECENRVRGVRSARYKKVRNAAEERDTLVKWGVTEADLFGVESTDDVGV
jgi:ribonuclease HI